MNIAIAQLRDLSASQIECWSYMQRTNPALASPYFRPEFAYTVNAVREDVEVAVISEGEQPVGFLPFHRTPWNSGRPLSEKLSDMHAIICAPGVRFDLSEIVSATGLRSWKFENLLSEDPAVKPFIRRQEDAPYIDLSEGFDAYIAQRANGKRLLKNYHKKIRKLEREVGPVRFSPHVPSPEVVETCLRWKADQYVRTSVPNILESQWIVELIESIAQARYLNFSGMVAVLYAGDRIAAIDIGMRSPDVWHPWFCAYDLELHAYSPGIVHLMEMIRVAPRLGLRRIDLGAGDDEYKNRFESGSLRVASGAIDVTGAVATTRRTWWRISDSLRRSPVFPLARKLRRAASHLEIE